MACVGGFGGGVGGESCSVPEAAAFAADGSAAVDPPAAGTNAAVAATMPAARQRKASPVLIMTSNLRSHSTVNDQRADSPSSVRNRPPATARSSVPAASPYRASRQHVRPHPDLDHEPAVDQDVRNADREGLCVDTAPAKVEELDVTAQDLHPAQAFRRTRRPCCATVSLRAVIQPEEVLHRRVDAIAVTGGEQVEQQTADGGESQPGAVAGRGRVRPCGDLGGQERHTSAGDAYSTMREGLVVEVPAGTTRHAVVTVTRLR